MPGPRPTLIERTAMKVEREARRRKATELAVKGWTYEQIADELGYGSRQAAFADVKRGLAPVAAEARKAAEHLFAVQLARLETAAAEVMKILGEYKPDGPDGPEYSIAEDQRLAAVDRLVKVSESTRRLLGLDAPAKTESRTEVEQTVTYQVAVAPEELEQL